MINVLAFKLLPGCFHLASVGVVGVYLRRSAPEQALQGVLLVGWNPIMLYETWGNGHNDAAMLFFILLAAWWMLRRHYTLANLALVAGALIKFIPALLIPAAVVLAWRNLAGRRERAGFILKTALGGLLMMVIFYFPFWYGPATFGVGRRMELFTTSLPAVIHQMLLPELGVGGAAQVVSLGAFGLLAVFILVQSVRAQAAERDFPWVAFCILAFYLLVACLWFQQWYSLWLVGLAPLLPEGEKRLAILFGLWVLTKQFLFCPLINPGMLRDPQSVWLEAALASGVLGLPWLAALLHIRSSLPGKAARHAS